MVSVASSAERTSTTESPYLFVTDTIRSADASGLPMAALLGRVARYPARVFIIADDCRASLIDPLRS